MYEKPNLNRVGAVEEVILGFISMGDDIDTHNVPDGMEFAFDGADLNRG
jgi:hypothetical protein